MPVLSIVTGATGFVGPYLVRELIRKEAWVKVLLTNQVDNLTGLQKRITKVYGNIMDRDSLHRAVNDVDAVFHLAAISNVNYSITHHEGTFETNATGTLNLLEEVRAMKPDYFLVFP
jgi:nucleoside-diphosphate-sugar epimerase